MNKFNSNWLNFLFFLGVAFLFIKFGFLAGILGIFSAMLTYAFLGSDRFKLKYLSRRFEKNKAHIEEAIGKIDKYYFPQKIRDELLERYPKLHEDDLSEIETGLRQFFKMCVYAPGVTVSMPSKVVDVAWHEFILHTKEYKNFCDDVFGYFLHHTPSSPLEVDKKQQLEDMQRTWRLACEVEDIDPLNCVRLPTIFSLDSKFQIKDGFYYSLDDMAERDKRDGSGYFSASQIACGTLCGKVGAVAPSLLITSIIVNASDGSGDSDGGSSCSSCGGGCGGD